MFQVHFPAQTSDAVLLQSVTEDIVQGRSQRILLVDDETALTTLYERLLKRLNYQVTISNSSVEALEVFRKTPGQFDLLVTDLTMPEMNGLELTREIHALRPALPVLLMSGFNAALNRRELNESGISETLEKPASPTAIAGALRRLLGQKEQKESA